MPIERMDSRRDTSRMHTLPAASAEAARLWGRSTKASLSATIELKGLKERSTPRLRVLGVWQFSGQRSKLLNI